MNRKRTKFVVLDAHRCVACWHCVVQCPKQVIGKVSVLWHRHVVFRHPEACVGCKRCTKVCPQGVFSVVQDEPFSPKPRRQMRRISVLLLLSTVGIAATGCFLHAAGHAPSFSLWHRWAVAHVVVSLLWLALAVHHVWHRRRWYKALFIQGVGRKRLMTLLLTLVSLALWLTGIVLLVCIDGSQRGVGLWHYAFGLLFVVLCALHLVYRWRRL